MLLKALSNISICSELLTRVSNELFDEFHDLNHLLSFFDEPLKCLVNQRPVKTGVEPQQSLSESLQSQGRIPLALVDPIH
jgi:hypothetical protein